jgi:hypothetical protein
MPKESELRMIEGFPLYISTETVTNSGNAFKVDGTVLNCDVGSLGAAGGCEFFIRSVNINRPVRATYFWQPTRLWYDVKALNSLEQDGKILLSPVQSHAWHMQGYETDRQSYRIICYVAVALFIFILILDFLPDYEEPSNLKE